MILICRYQSYKKNHDGAEWDKADNRIDLEGDIAAKVDVERFMATLSEKDRQILELRVEGYTYQEIADKVGYITHSAVKKRIDKIGRIFQEHTNTDIGFE